ncbi:hypothetical protein [Actinomadura flavalba]|uniref:hypothetical protein n=1 Tax=Actinomadura flavalba TaxID=1120938 RepID=UPI00037A24BC|nr:hypothetical protein [Actinomadura flavalba]
MSSHRPAALIAALAVSAGVLLATSSTFEAAEAAVPDGAVRAASGAIEASTGPVRWSRVLYSREECITTQSEFARYYRIVQPCVSWNPTAWRFSYTDR